MEYVIFGFMFQARKFDIKAAPMPDLLSAFEDK